MQIKKLPFITIFVAGLFVGMFFVNFGESILLENTGLLDEYTLYEMKYSDVDSSALFYYVLRLRIGRILLLALLATTYFGIVVCGGTALWYGICSGIFLATAVIRYGIRGILLVIVGIFPHYIVYVPVMIAMFLWCQSTYRMIYLDRSIGWNKADRLVLSKKILQLAGIIAIFVVGCVLESFVNPALWKGLLHFF